MMNQEEQVRSIVGLDAHPHLFSAAGLVGPDAFRARTEWVVDRIPIERLEQVLKKHVHPDALIVLEASGNSFAVAARLAAIGLRAVVLESQAVGKVGKAYCATDRVDAVKIARVYFSGLAHEVWQPDAQAAERRELFFGHRNAVRDSVRARNRIWGYLNGHSIRRPRGLRLASKSALTNLLALRTWNRVEQLLLEEEVLAFQQAEARRKRFRSEIASIVAGDPNILQMIRLLGIRDKVAFALAAFIGPISRFENPKKLVAYFGLNPSVQRSGIGGGNGPIGCNGRADVRSLLIQAAHSILKYAQGAIRRWALALKIRKGANIAVAALARKLVVSVWYLLRGLFTPLTDVSAQIHLKLRKIASEIGPLRLAQLGFVSTKDFIEQKERMLLQSC